PTVEDSLQDIMQPVAPVINSVTGATLEHGYTDGGPSVSATIAEDHTATYQWYRNTTNSNKGGTAVSGATESSYAVPLKHTVDSTEYYYCVITATRTDNGLAATTTSSAVAVVYQSGTHDWKETSRKEPTCTAEGSVGYACTLCPATKTEKLAKLGHEYVSVKVTQPT
ncbi:MAG: hypothetical protein IIW12_00550, partial [Oscillospiraceae bacterium]|nr:hypothetical protein [Oscillospiraceae bacterium]